jgi:hypothetical protein
MLSARKDSWKPRHELGECGGSVDKNTVGLPDFIHAHFLHFLHATAFRKIAWRIPACSPFRRNVMRLAARRLDYLHGRARALHQHIGCRDIPGLTGSLWPVRWKGAATRRPSLTSEPR